MKRAEGTMRSVCTVVAGIWLVGTGTAAAEAPPDVMIPEFEIPAVAGAEGATTVTSQVPIEDLLKTSVYAPSKKPQLVRESPGVVTVVTREEILTSGARDLIDVLNLVPGFTFGLDVQGVVSVGFRGNWGHEGKVLVLIDGMELNELAYSTLQFGHHYPVEHIERVEVIRGPGSSVYGGFAELAVINVITRGARRIGGATVAARYGQMSETFGGRSVSLEVGRAIGDLSVSVSGMIGQGVRSQATYTDATGATFDLEEGSKLEPMFVNTAIEWRGAKLRFLYDGYSIETIDGFGENSPAVDRMHFTSLIVDGSFDWNPSDAVSIMPRVSFKRQTPWRILDKASPVYYNKTAERLTGGLAGSFDVLDNLTLLVGFEAFRDHGYLNDLEIVGLQTQFGTENEVTYTNLSAYSQATLSHSIANLTAGARFEHHSHFGSSFVPRVGLTKVAGRFHVKLLAALAFRAPGLENINLNPDITPERTTVFELETGLQLSDNAFVSANVFDITIRSPIIYDTVDGTDAYFNFDRVGTRGAEVDLKIKDRWGHVYASGSYYTAAGKDSDVAVYRVEGHDDIYLGIPQWKIATNAAFKLVRDLTVSPTLTFLSERYGFASYDMDGNGVLARFDPVLLANLYVSYPNLGVKGLDLGAGVYNILDADNPFIQPYDGGHPPMPGRGREFVARLAYSQPF